MKKQLIQITKQDVIKALEQSPLIACVWREVDDVDDAQCRYCAVGATLAGIVPDSRLGRAATLITRRAEVSDDGHLKKTIDDKNYMAALSIKFEREAIKLADRNQTAVDFLTAEELATLKPSMVKWVSETFPQGMLFEEEIEL
jgi:hypothetical protein